MDKKNDNLDTKPELVKTKVVEKKEYKKIHGFGLVITIIYSLVAFYVVYFLAMYLLFGIMDFNIVEILIALAGFAIVALPYILLSMASKKRDKKLQTAAVIYELCCLVIVFLFFVFFLWPAINKSINNQWCGMVDSNGNQIPCGWRTR
jgi:amino acid transporter